MIRFTAAPAFLLFLLLKGPGCESFVSDFQRGRHPSSACTTTTTCLFYDEKDSSAQDALERTAAHLEKLRQLNKKKPHAPQPEESDYGDDVTAEEVESRKRTYLMQPANALKDELKLRKLPRNGRKPDLARRLAEDDMAKQQKELDVIKESPEAWVKSQKTIVEEVGDDDDDELETTNVLSRFAGIPLSQAAGLALGRAGFTKPTPIQAAAIPLLSKGGGASCILHAETGSGKSLTYLLPITEHFWKVASQKQKGKQQRALILTPTRELAAQLAGIASVLAPPGSVRLVAHPTNLMSDGQKDRGEGEYGGRLDNSLASPPSIFIGSAKAVMHSLYGDGKMPASPTPKPAAMAFLQSVNWLVMDEVDRLLNVKKSRSDKMFKKIHEKPAAVLSAAVERSTLGKARIVAASATVGRPLKRELSRVLGLLPNECPPVIRGTPFEDDNDDLSDEEDDEDELYAQAHSRAVKIPETVDHFILGVDGNSEGKLLTGAYQLIKHLAASEGGTHNRILLVLAKSFGMNTQNTIGALKHFDCQPEPKSLLDVLEADGTDQMIEVHRQVSKAAGVGESSTSSSYFQRSNNGAAQDGYLLVTGEDTVRGLHLDGLDIVIVVGRPNGPDEYTHIAGRTGRAGRHGKVISILGRENAQALKSWEKMLDVTFTPMDVKNPELKNPELP